MSKLSKEVLLEQIDTWIHSCKYEGIKIHGSCKKCICGEICKQATQQIKEMIQETEKAKLIWDATCPGIATTWLPTAENINALPKPIYEYIAGLETNADPPSMVAENIIMKDTIKALEIKCEEKPAVDEGFVNTWARELEADLLPYSVCVNIDKKKVKYMLREAGVEVVEK